MSLENLERILPMGVVSKKSKGARWIAHNISACIETAAFKVPSRGVRSQNMDEMALIEEDETPENNFSDSIKVMRMKRGAQKNYFSNTKKKAA